MLKHIKTAINHIFTVCCSSNGKLACGWLDSSSLTGYYCTYCKTGFKTKTLCKSKLSPHTTLFWWKIYQSLSRLILLSRKHNRRRNVAQLRRIKSGITQRYYYVINRDTKARLCILDYILLTLDIVGLQKLLSWRRGFSGAENRFIVAPVALNAPLNFVTMGATAI